jgi:hypothetical protein
MEQNGTGHVRYDIVRIQATHECELLPMCTLDMAISALASLGDRQTLVIAGSPGVRIADEHDDRTESR